MNPDQPIERRIKARDRGRRLDVFLAGQPEVESRPLAKSMIRSGRVELDGGPCKPSSSLEVGQVVRFTVPPPTPEVAPAEHEQASLRVLHDDPHILVIDKQPGIAVHPPDSPRKSVAPCISDLALQRCGSLPTIAGEDRPGIVHRLDKDTSGVMVLARTDEAFRFLQSQFKARTVRKEYRAICFGDPRFDSDYVEGAIAVDPRRGDRMTVVEDGGKEASTYWEVVQRYGDLCHLRCLPRSGRTHQIRVHMASVGHPLVADRAYTAHRRVDRLPEGAPDPGRQALHAWSLSLLHPRTHEEVQFDAPIPEDLNKLLRWLDRRGVVGE